MRSGTLMISACCMPPVNTGAIKRGPSITNQPRQLSSDDFVDTPATLQHHDVTLTAPRHTKAPFTRYNLLSNRLSFNRLSNPFDNLLYCVTGCQTGCTTQFDILLTFNTVVNNRFDNRLDVCLHDTAGCQTVCTTGCIV